MTSFRMIELEEFDVDEDGILQDLRRRQSGIALDDNGIYQDSSQPLPYLTQHTDSGIGSNRISTPTTKLSDPYSKPALSAPEYLTDATHPLLDEKSLNLSDFSTKDIPYFEETLRSVDLNYMDHGGSVPNSQEAIKTQSSQEHSDPHEEHYRHLLSHNIAPPTTTPNRTPNAWSPALMTPTKSPIIAAHSPLNLANRQSPQAAYNYRPPSPTQDLRRESEAVINAIIQSSTAEHSIKSDTESHYGVQSTDDDEAMDLEVANHYISDMHVPNGFLESRNNGSRYPEGNRREGSSHSNQSDRASHQHRDNYSATEKEHKNDLLARYLDANEGDNSVNSAGEITLSETQTNMLEEFPADIVKPVITIQGPSQETGDLSPRLPTKYRAAPPYQFQDTSRFVTDDANENLHKPDVEVSAFPASIDYGASIPFAESGEDGVDSVDQLIKLQMLEHQNEQEIDVSHVGDIAHSLIEFEALEVQLRIEAEKRRNHEEADVLGEFLQNLDNSDFNNDAEQDQMKRSGSQRGSRPSSRQMSPSSPSKIPTLRRHTPGQSPAISRSGSRQNLTSPHKVPSRRGSRESLIHNLKLKPSESSKAAGKTDGRGSSHASDSEGSKGNSTKKGNTKMLKKSPPQKKPDMTPSSYKIRSQKNRDTKTGPVRAKSNKVPQLDGNVGENSGSDMESTHNDLRKRLQAEGRTRKQQDEIIQQLQDDYDNLLTKYALAEVTIDQLRLGSKINLYSDSPTALQATLGNQSSAHRPQSFSMGHLAHGVLGTTGTSHKPKAFSMGDINQNAGGSRSQSQVELPVPRSTDMTPVNFQGEDFQESSEFYSDPLIQVTGSGESIKMSLMYQAQSLAEQMESFRVLLEEEQLSVEQQERIWDKIKTDYEKLQEDYKQAKDDTELLKRLNMSEQETEFDDDKILEGDLFRLGMKLDDLHEKVEDNIKLAKRRTPFQDMGRPLSQLQRRYSAKFNAPYSHPQTPVDKLMHNGDHADAGVEGELDHNWRQLQRDYNALLDLYKRMKKMPRTQERDKDIDALMMKLRRLYNEAPDPSMLHRLPQSDDESVVTLLEPLSPKKLNHDDKRSPGEISPPESNYLTQGYSYKEDLPHFSSESLLNPGVRMSTRIPVGPMLTNDDERATEHMNKRLGLLANGSMNVPRNKNNADSNSSQADSQPSPAHKILRPGELDADSGFIGSESNRSAQLRYQLMMQDRQLTSPQATPPIREAVDEYQSTLPAAAMRPPPQEHWIDSDISSARDHPRPLPPYRKQRSVSSAASESTPMKNKQRNPARATNRRSSRPASRHLENSETEVQETVQSARSEKMQQLQNEISKLKQDLEQKQDRLTVPAVAVPAAGPYWNPALLHQYSRYDPQHDDSSEHASQQRVPRGKENVRPDGGRGRLSSFDDYDSYDQYSIQNKQRLRRITEDSKLTTDDDDDVYLSDPAVERTERKQNSGKREKQLIQRNNSLDSFRTPSKRDAKPSGRTPMKAFPDTNNSNRISTERESRSVQKAPERFAKYDRYLSRSRSIDRIDRSDHDSSTKDRARRSHSQEKRSDKRSESYSEDGRRSHRSADKRSHRHVTESKSVPCPYCGGSGTHTHCEVNCTIPHSANPAAPVLMSSMQVPAPPMIGFLAQQPATPATDMRYPPPMVPASAPFVPQIPVYQPQQQVPSAQPLNQVYRPAPVLPNAQAPQAVVYTPLMPQQIQPQQFAPQPQVTPLQQPVPQFLSSMLQYSSPHQPIPQFVSTPHYGSSPQYQNVPQQHPGQSVISHVPTENDKTQASTQNEEDKFIKLPLRLYEESKDVKYFVREYSSRSKTGNPNHSQNGRYRSSERHGESKLERGKRRSASLPRNTHRKYSMFSDNDSCTSVDRKRKTGEGSRSSLKTNLDLTDAVKLAKDIEKYSGKIRNDLHTDIKRTMSVQQLWV